MLTDNAGKKKINNDATYVSKKHKKRRIHGRTHRPPLISSTMLTKPATCSANVESPLLCRLEDQDLHEEVNELFFCHSQMNALEHAHLEGSQDPDRQIGLLVGFRSMLESPQTLVGNDIFKDWNTPLGF